jgi:endonuclease/exonuclease/phosphatase family metal-dependent hydrolase
MLSTNNIKFTTWNICTDRRAEETFARPFFPEWRSRERIESIKHEILNSKSDIIHIQEARNFTNQHGEKVDSLSHILEFFEDHGYNVSFQLRAPLWPQSFYYITAYKADRFQLSKTDSFYLTKTPDKLKGDSNKTGTTPEETKDIIRTEALEHGFGEAGEFSVLASYLVDSFTGNKICTLNIHKGLASEHRKHASKIILEYVENLDKDIKVIMSGDFNSFDDGSGAEQMSILTDSPLLTDISNNIILPNGDPAPNLLTFIAYPYDCVPPFDRNIDIGEARYKIANSQSKEELTQLSKLYCASNGRQLDHILIGPNLHKVSNVMLNVTPQFHPGPDSYEEEDLNDYIFKHIEKGPAFASDHQPLTVTLNYYDDYLDL